MNSSVNVVGVIFQDPLFDVPKYNKPPEIPKGTSSGASSNIKKSSSAVNLADDFTSVFGGDIPWNDALVYDYM